MLGYYQVKFYASNYSQYVDRKRVKSNPQKPSLK